MYDLMLNLAALWALSYGKHLVVGDGRCSIRKNGPSMPEMRGLIAISNLDMRDPGQPGVSGQD